MALSELSQETFLFSASAGSNTTLSFSVLPIVTSNTLFERVIPLSLKSLLTWIRHDVVTPFPAFTSIYVMPSIIPVTTPLLSTVAIRGLRLSQVTLLSDASSGDTVAESVTVSPSKISAISGVTETLVTGIILAETFTSQVAVLEPSDVVTVMVAEPALTAVTLPFPSTVATSVADDFQLTALFVAFEGDTVATSDSEPPSSRLSVLLLRDTPVTAIVDGVTGPSLFPPPPLLPLGCSSGPQLNMIAEDNTATAMAETTLEIVFSIIRSQFVQM